MQAQRVYNVPRRSPTSLSNAALNSRGVATQGTQTSPSMPTQANQQAPATQAAQPGRKKKRSPGSIYALAARQRRIQQQYTNLHHPPSMEDIWICEFCEYESIFGRPPEALIRQYEIKDRKERKRLAEKKRLLEKAKMKGRKNKKATKNSSKNAHHAGYQHGYDRAPGDQPVDEPGVHEDDYCENEYEEEPVHDPAPAPPFQTPLPAGNHPKGPANLGQTDGGTGRPP